MRKEGRKDACLALGDGPNCVVQAVTFTEPRDLAGVANMATRLDGSVLALWRSEPVCVGAVLGSGPSLPPPAAASRASQFAYQDADGIQARRLSGPPATDGGWSTALLARFVQEWAAARQSGVQFSGAVFWVPDTIDFKAGTPTAANTEAHRPVPTYRSDDGTVLYLRGHESALSGVFPAQTLTC